MGRAPLQGPAGLQVPDGETIVSSTPSNLEDSVHVALAEERARQEQRNHKVLKVLQEKDAIIHELQMEHGRLHAEVLLFYCSPCSIY